MAKFVLTNARLFTGGVDLTTVNNKVELSAEREQKETTSFGSSGWTESIAGLGQTEINGEGQWEANAVDKVDDILWAQLAGLTSWTVSPNAGAVGDIAYFTNALTGMYQLGGQVGDVAPWTAKAMSSWPLVRGAIAHPSGTARTATGTGTAQQLGAVSATQNLYAALHVLSVSGTATPTLTVTIQSDNASGFPSSATALSFAAATAIGGQILRVPGALTDDWFRPQWTISGTNPSFLFVVAFGIA